MHIKCRYFSRKNLATGGVEPPPQMPLTVKDQEMTLMPTQTALYDRGFILCSHFSNLRENRSKNVWRPVHEITAGHRSLSGTISCVTDRIRFLPVTMTGRFSNFNSISYTEDRHELRVTGTKCRLLDTMSGTGGIFISGAAREVYEQNNVSWMNC